MRTKIKKERKVKVKRTAEQILTDICNEFATEGCQGCGVVGIGIIDEARQCLGWDKINRKSLKVG